MSSSAAFTPDHHHHHHHLGSPFEQLYYIHCHFCNTILAVSVPCTSLSQTMVTVKCGHCTKILYLDHMRAHVLPASATTAANLGHNFFSHQHLMNIQEDLRNNPTNMLINQLIPDPFGPLRVDELLNPPVVNRPPEKRQRVPSAYNRFIKEEIQRIKAGNPDISHREAFSAAAKNWAHYPNIHFGLMPDQTLKNPDVCQQEIDLRTKDALSTGNVGVLPY